MRPLLLLGGTREASTLARHLADMDIPATLSLAGVTRTPALSPLPGRRGGFGGIEGLIEWLQANQPPAVIDATHPFAARMQTNAEAACTATDTPRIRLLRPPWPTRAGWQHVPDLDTAMDHVPAGARVLVTTGQDHAPFLAHDDCTFVLRTIEPVAPLPDHITPLLARPPFQLSYERALMTQNAVTHLLTKNAGGTGTAKLDAADALGVRTIVIDRPQAPAGPIAQSVAEALTWLQNSLRVAN